MKIIPTPLVILTFAFVLSMVSCNELEAPVTQIAFEQARANFYAAYSDAPNEVKKSAVYIEALEHGCVFEQEHGRTFNEWIGEISTIRTDQGGDEIEQFSIKASSIHQNVYYEQSDIQKGTALSYNISQFAEGDLVYFSFTFDQGSQTAKINECFNETSMTEFGSVADPEFDVTFTTLRSIE
jgi:hypothetical protein